jgi:YidC/Oxa1 family membrane protein insertase
MFEIFNIIFVDPITNLMVAFYQAFQFAGIPFAFGLSIIALTAVVKLILWPLTATQIKSAYKMQKVAPHISALKDLHKGDAKKLQEETMRLYKEHGVNPAAGCLPLLVQIPFIYGLYHVLDTAVKVTNVKHITAINNDLYFDFLKLNSVWDTTMFGLSLGESPSKLMSVTPLILLAPLITAVLQFVLSKMMMPEETLDMNTAIAAKTPKKEDDFQAAFQKQSLFIFPVMIGFFSYTLPLGLSLYWNTFSVFGILQQYILVGAGAATPWVEKVKKRKNSNEPQAKQISSGVISTKTKTKSKKNKRKR